MKVALIELGGSHAECLYSQLLFLKTIKAEVTLIYDPRLELTVRDFIDEFDNTILLPEPEGAFFYYLKLRKIIINNQFDKVIFNTGQGDVCKKICALPFPKTIEFLGLLHNTKKLYGSFGQKIISSKVKKYFVLSDYLLEKTAPFTNKKFLPFYPIYFKPYPVKINKPEGEIWITIPGAILLERREYVRLLECLENIDFDKRIKFIFLGGGPKEEVDIVKGLIEKTLHPDNFLYWSEHVINDDFHSYLQLSDYIMPLINILDGYDFRISGTFNLAYAYNKTMLIHKSLNMDEFQENSIIYDYDGIEELLKTILTLKKIDYKAQDKFNFDYQAQQYTEFLLMK
ncbi:hypothetical protein [Flammeovirga sp. SubArs3]|uniref:hypothetical protein n=1 Tax=Flammeovirga sp. SubArs3 TaxID=2995316 RepID=UPI00248C980D|nr:hypothetical protein [Flammeovirga sp. SubArs3]